MDIIELAPGVRPACCQRDAVTGQLLEAGIAINMENACKVLQMLPWAQGAAVRFIIVDGSGWIGACPATLVAGIDPKPSGFRSASARFQHRKRRIVSEQAVGCENVVAKPVVQGIEPPAGAAYPSSKGGE